MHKTLFNREQLMVLKARCDEAGVPVTATLIARDTYLVVVEFEKALDKMHVVLLEEITNMTKQGKAI